jgi:hypothetical protein
VNLSQEDTQAIVDGVVKELSKVGHSCRFPRVSEVDIEDMVRIHHEVKPDDLKEAIKFYKNMNQIMEQSGKTIRTLTLTLGFGVIASLLLLGLWAKIKTEIGM